MIGTCIWIVDFSGEFKIRSPPDTVVDSFVIRIQIALVGVNGLGLLVM